MGARKSQEPWRPRKDDRVDHSGEPGKPGTVIDVDTPFQDYALVHWDDTGCTDWTDADKLRQWKETP